MRIRLGLRQLPDSIFRDPIDAVRHHLGTQEVHATTAQRVDSTKDHVILVIRKGTAEHLASLRLAGYEVDVA